MRGRVNASTGVHGISKPKGSPYYHAYFRVNVDGKVKYVGCGLHRSLDKAKLALAAGKEYYRTTGELPQFTRLQIKIVGKLVYSDDYGHFCLID